MVFMNKFLVSFIFFIFLFLSCNSQSNSSQIIKYDTEYSLLTRTYWMLRGKTKMVVGNQLEISHKDSTFVFTTCNCNTSGSWEMKNDSLFLNHLVVNKKLEEIGCYQPAFYLKIDEKQLMGRNEEETIEVLKKEK